MNFKKQCLLNACKHSNVNLDELLKTYKIPYQYTNENKDELFFEPNIQEFIAKKLDTILPYFYGMLDDKDLFDSKLTYTMLHEAAKNFSLTEHLRSIGLGEYTYDLLNPSNNRSIDDRYRDHLFHGIYTNKYYFRPGALPKNEEICLHTVNANPISLKDIPMQTEKICIKAVSKFAYALEYVENQTEAIALAAVQNNGTVLEIVSPEFHTKEVVSCALKQNPLSFRYSHLKDYDTCLKAVKANGINLEFVPDEFKDHNMIMTALNSNGWAIMFLEEQTEEYALTAVLQNTETSLNIDEDIRNNNAHIQYIYELIKQRHGFLNK